MRPNVEGWKDPRSVALVPGHRTPRQPSSQIVQNEVSPERQLHLDDVEAEGRSGEGRKVLAGEVLEAGGGKVAAVGRVDIRVMRAEVRSGDEDLRAVARHTVDLSHGAHG